VAAYCGVAPGSKVTTLDPTLTFGMGGSSHTRADAEAGAVSPGAGSTLLALPDTHSAIGGPLPTTRATFGVEPSGSSAKGWGLRGDRAAATGSAARRPRAPREATGTRQWNPPNIHRRPPPRASIGARKATNANRNAQAMTRLARIAVLV